MLRTKARRIVMASFAPAVCALVAGCLSGNPSYFPYLLPGGPAVRTHPKPAGQGYFADFDPNACRVELRPDTCTARVRGTQVFIATVYDGDNTPRRKRRVEWMIEGPGSIVEVDESGYTHGRGMKVDNKYAFSYTDYLEHCITRGNNDPSDDFTVGPGQTWCVVTSAIEGETTVTAYVPAIADWEKNRAFARVTWGDAHLLFPPPVTARAGGEHTFNTKVMKGSEAAAGFRVRYRIVDGPPAALVGARGGQVDSVTEAVSNVGEDGTGRINITQPAAASGTNRIAIEVTKPNPDAPGQFTLVSKGETKITWQTDRPPVPAKESKLTLSLEGPSQGAVGESLTYRLRVTNTGDATADKVRVQTRLDEGLAVEKGKLDDTLGSLSAGQSKTLTLNAVARKRGNYAVFVSASASGDLVALPQTATVEVSDVQINLSAHGPARSFVGQDITWQLVVRNTGDAPIDRIVVRATLPPEVKFVKVTDGGKIVGKQIVWELGSAPAQQERTIAVTVVGEKPAVKAALVATVSATSEKNGDANAKPLKLERTADASVEIVGVPALQISVKDANDPVGVGQRTTYTVRVKNAGTQAATKIEVICTVPELMKPMRGTGPAAAAKIDKQMLTFPIIASLAPNAETTFVIEVEGQIPGEGRFRAEARSPTLSQPIRAEEPTRILGRETRPMGDF